jgi:hypothetical protein
MRAPLLEARRRVVAFGPAVMLCVAPVAPVAPLGAFAGELPVAGTLREGWGVTERHSARW